MTNVGNRWMILSLALVAALTFAVVVPRASADIKKTLEDAFIAITDLQAQINAISAVNTNQQSQLNSLQADVNTLKDAVQVDGTTGELTIQSADNIILEPATGKVVRTMGDSEVIGDNVVQGGATLEGNVAMMEDATVMGASALEGQVSAMSDTFIAGFLTLPLQENTIDGNGMLTPSGSSVAVEVTTLQGLQRIAPAEVGTELTIRFELDPGDFLEILDCARGSFGNGGGDCDRSNGPNIDLNIPVNPMNPPATPGLLHLEEDGILKVVFTDRMFWEETSKTEASIYVVAIGPTENPPTNTNVPPNTSISFTVSCDEGDIAFGGNIEGIYSGSFTIDGTKIVGNDYTLDITTGSNPNDFTITASCLHLSY